MTNLPASLSKKAEDYLQKVRSAQVCARVAFVIDATASREPTWDSAAQLQAEMFSEAAKLGGLEMQIVFFRGANEVGASTWTSNARELQHFMGRVRCEGGHTKYARAFARVREEHQRKSISAVIVIGDDLEEEPRMLYDAIAGLGVPFFLFQEGDNSQTRAAFEKIRDLTKGAYCAFNTGAIAQLREYLRAIARFAVGGLTALSDLRSEAAVKLLGQMKK
jgi:Mg-chelatase subunit ChlD